MSGGATTVGDGIDATLAPRNVWAGIHYVRLLPSPTTPLTNKLSGHVPPGLGPLRCFRRYSHRL